MRDVCQECGGTGFVVVNDYIPSVGQFDWSDYCNCPEGQSAKAEKRTPPEYED